MKVIIAGFGKVGSTLCRQLLDEGNDVTLIDRDSETINNALARYDIMAVCGNCASAGTLKQAEVEDAGLFIATTQADEINLLACATAHEINPEIRTIGRVRDPEYYNQIYGMPDFFGLSLVVNPELQSAHQIEKLLKIPGFLKMESFARGRAELVELKVEAGSRLEGLLLADLPGTLHCQVLVSTVTRDGQTLIPKGQFVVQAGDRLYIVAPTDELMKLQKAVNLSRQRTGRVLICGGGPISYYLANKLEKSGIKVTLIEKDPKRCDDLAGQLNEADVIQGDACDRELLESLHIEKFDALVAATGFDELNIIISLGAREYGVKQIYTKIDRISISSIIETLPLGHIISPKEICGSLIAKFVRGLRNQKGAAVSVYKIGEGNAEALEFSVDADTENCGVPLKNIKLKQDVLIAGILRGRKVLIPNGESSYNVGDSVIIMSGGEHKIYSLNDIFAG